MGRTLAAILAATALTPSFAQSTPAEEIADNGDIVVTATKRAENLQDVPQSIQAFGTQTLERYNVSSFADVQKLVPSMSFQTSQPGSTTVYFRGVASGGDGNHSGSLPSVGVYLDEQPITTIGGTLDIHVYDMARIEALSGPQGTLYGASSQAGTIRYITNKPDSSAFDAGADFEVNRVRKGGTGGKFEGFVNQPLGDNAAIRLVGFYRKDAGYIDNVPATRSFTSGVTINNNSTVEKDYNDIESYGGRAALQLDLDDNWTVTPTFLYQRQKSTGFFGTDQQVGDLQVQHFGDEYRKDEFWQAALTVQGKIADFDLTYAGAYLDRDIDQFSDYTDYAVAYDILYAQTGGSFSSYFTNNAGAFVDPGQHILGADRYKKMSHELRLASPSDKPFRVIGGLFYQRQTHGILQDYKIFDLADATSVNGRPGTIWLTQQKRIDKDYAAFGEASYDITSQLTLTGGLRVFKYDNSLFGFFGFGDGFSSRTGVAACYTDANGAFLGPIREGSPCTNLAEVVNGKLVPKRAKGNGVTHRLNLSWKPTDNSLIYATWSRGFRPGGLNRRATVDNYDSDYLTNYEIGWKYTTSDGSFRFNGAIFMEDWKKFQYSFLGANSFTEIHNGPDARIKGIEIDVALRPARGLTFGIAGTYVDAKTRKNLCAIDDPTGVCDPTAGNSIVSPRGTRLPVTPKYKLNLTGRYDFAMGDYKAHLQGVMVYADDATSDLRVPFAVGIGRLPSYVTADFAAGIDFGQFNAEAFITNAFDSRGQLSRNIPCGQCLIRPYAFVTKPQTIGLRMGWKY
ncbi:TonB-dependent receptor [Sphingomonas sp. SRS2]|uniref:TonB-dependent receptor n=1 Tax=Sphingomonas sp. SRS2 TaxID=133190 RepID=UPI00128B4EB9|nr:TonB-dependent receptor [Sphingomonas sp. SRS2]